MNKLIGKSLVLAVLMVASSAAAYFMKPHKQLASQHSNLDYEVLLPKRFGEWHADMEGPVYLVNPQQQELIDSLYKQTVSRTYINSSGQRIMLSLAYGGDQNHGNQIHKPEVCYPAQGFAITAKEKGTVATEYGALPVMRLVARSGQRSEPVTYWIRVGDKLVRGSLEQNFARIGYGVKGYIPDGLLFRVSEVSENPSESFKNQDRFISDLLSALNPSSRAAMIGQHK